MIKKAVVMLSLVAAMVATPGVASAAEGGPNVKEALECLTRNNVWEGENGLECLI